MYEPAAERVQEETDRLRNFPRSKSNEEIHRGGVVGVSGHQTSLTPCVSTRFEPVPGNQLLPGDSIGLINFGVPGLMNPRYRGFWLRPSNSNVDWFSGGLV